MNNRFLFSLVIAIFAIMNFSSCDKDDAEQSYKSQLHGWWLHVDELEDGSMSSIAWAYWFHDDVVEGEYMLMDHKESGFSRNAIGKWYMNKDICVDFPYIVVGDTIFIGKYKDKILLLKNGKLVNSDGQEYIKQ